MKLNNLLKAFMVVGLALMALAGSSFAQTSKGSIGGTITDSTDAVIAGATVTAKNLDTGEVRTTTTGSNGQYRIDAVEPGNYTVTANQKGFAPLTVQKVLVAGSVVTSINAKLTVGANNQSIVVEASAATVQTENGEITHTIGTQELSDLPISSLNPYSLATTLPGVTTVTSDRMTNGTAYSVDGSRPRDNNFLVEGQDNNDAGLHGQGLQPGNIDAVKEVSVQTNSFSAEFGHGASVANVIFKSGTNRFHGAVWDRLWNSSIDATDHYSVMNDVPKDKYRENIYGFDVSGPVVKNKLFFFTSYQWDKYRSTTSGGALYVPTEAGHAVLAALPSNTQVQTLLNVYGNLRGNASLSGPNSYDLGGNRGVVEVAKYYREGIASNTDSPEFDAKGDWTVTTKDTVNLRYIRTNYTAPYDLANFPSQLPGFDAAQSGTAHNAGITWTRIFSPTLINEVRASYGRIGFHFINRADDNALINTPTISITGLTGWGANGSLPQGRFHNTYQLQDTVSWTKGNHFFKFGVDFADIRVVDQIPYNTYGTISYAANAGTYGDAYTALGNYVDNFGGTSATVGKTFGNPYVHATIPSQNYFANDTWKLRSNLTVVIGLRYEYNGAPANNLNFPTVDPLTLSATTYKTVTKQQPDGSNIGPRVSFSYQPRFWKGLFGDGKTAIRGGFGVFYGGIFTNILDNTQAASPNSASGLITSTLSKTNPRGIGNWSSQISSLTPVLTAQTAITSQVPHLLSPETLQWNFNIERELPSSFIFQLGYTGSRGEHLYGQNQYNPYTGGSSRLNTAYGSVLLRDNSGDSIYHAFTTNLDRKYKNGVQFHMAYTFSKFIDDVSEVFTSGNWSAYPAVQYPIPRGKYDRSVSSFDHKHRLVFTYTYEVPKLAATDSFTKTVGYLTNGWRVAGTTSIQAGTPYNVETGTYDTNGDGISNDRPDLSSKSAPMNTYAWTGDWLGGSAGTLCEGVAALKSKLKTCNVVSAKDVHWVIPSSGVGNFGRNGLVGPKTVNFDFMVNRNFKIHESHSFDVRADIFDLFNHTSPDGGGYYPSFTVTTGIPAGTFNNFSTSQHGGRTIRMLLKYSF